MDSKKYADKVIGLHDFSLECYPVGGYYGYIFFDDGVDRFHLDPVSLKKRNLVDNFIFSILSRFYEHFIGNLCVKEKDFWYVWDKVTYELNNNMVEQFYCFNAPNRYYYEKLHEPDFLLPNSHEFIKILQASYGSSPKHYISGGILSISYTELDFENHTTYIKELRLPIPTHRRYSPIDRNISFHW